MKYSKISEYKVKKILKFFAEDIPATKTANLLGLNRNTIDSHYRLFREMVIKQSINDTAKETGEFELDESYFGAKRVRGKRGRGAAGKTPVFGLLKRNGKVFVRIVENCSKGQLMPIIQGKILEGATIHTDGWKAYDGLVLNGYDHYRVFHSQDEFVRGKSHVNGIEAFWSFAKRRMAKFNGIRSTHFLLYLKETEFRYNNRGDNLYDIMLMLYKNYHKI